MLWLLAARGLLDGLVFLLANWPALASARRHRAQRRRAAAAARGVANSSGGGLGSLAAGRASLTRQATEALAQGKEEKGSEKLDVAEELRRVATSRDLPCSPGRGRPPRLHNPVARP
jgi:hypothetical protein